MLTEKSDFKGVGFLLRARACLFAVGNRAIVSVGLKTVPDRQFSRQADLPR
jgi:hypothetical protein